MVTVLVAVLIILSSSVEFSEDFDGFGEVDFIIIHEFAVIERYLWEHLVHFLFAVDGIHVLRCHFILFFIISDDPGAARG